MSDKKFMAESADELSCHYAGVMSAEAERVVHDRVDPYLPWRVRNVVEIAERILVVDVDRRRRSLRLDGLGADGHLDGAGRAEHVARCAFGRTHGEFLRVIAENTLDCLRLANIALRRRRAVGVDIIDI